MAKTCLMLNRIAWLSSKSNSIGHTPVRYCSSRILGFFTIIQFMSVISYSLINTRPNKWRAIFFVEWYYCTAFVRTPLTQLTSVARVSPEPAKVGRLQGLPRLNSYYHFMSNVSVNLRVRALECLSWLAMVPVSIADAMCATAP